LFGVAYLKEGDVFSAPVGLQFGLQPGVGHSLPSNTASSGASFALATFFCASACPQQTLTHDSPSLTPGEQLRIQKAKSALNNQISNIQTERFRLDQIVNGGVVAASQWKRAVEK